MKNLLKKFLEEIPGIKYSPHELYIKGLVIIFSKKMLQKSEARAFREMLIQIKLFFQSKKKFKKRTEFTRWVHTNIDNLLLVYIEAKERTLKDKSFKYDIAHIKKHLNLCIHDAWFQKSTN